MLRPVELLPEALDELREAARWYEAKRAGLGRELEDELSRVLADLEPPEQFGTAGSSLSGHDVRRAFLWRFPYRVIFQVTPARLLVVAFAHRGRRSRYWEDRLQ